MLSYPHPPALRVNAFRLSRSLHKITQQMTPSGFKNDLLWTCHENHRLHSQINNTLRQCQCHQNDTPAQVATVLPRQELLQSPSNPLVCRPISHERRSPERPAIVTTGLYCQVTSTTTREHWVRASPHAVYRTWLVVTVVLAANTMNASSSRGVTMRNPLEGPNHSQPQLPPTGTRRQNTASQMVTNPLEGPNHS